MLSLYDKNLEEKVLQRDLQIAHNIRLDIIIILEGSKIKGKQCKQ